MPYDKIGYRAIVVLKSNKTVEYPLGENKGFWIDDIIPKDNVLIRKWQKGRQQKFDMLVIIGHKSDFNNQ